MASETAIDAASLSLGAAPPSRVDSLRAVLATGDPAGTASALHPRPAARLEGTLTGLTLPADTRPVLGRTIRRAAIDATVLGATRVNSTVGFQV